MRNGEREFILDFLQLYRSLPPLWNLKCEDYTNRTKKTKCYQILVAKYREKYTDATKEDVTKKINALRTNFRKEIRRMQDLKEQTGEQPVSTLWYFHALDFLLDDSEIQLGEELQYDPLQSLEKSSQNGIVQSEYSDETDTQSDVNEYQLSESSLEDVAVTLPSSVKKRRNSTTIELPRNKLPKTAPTRNIYYDKPCESTNRLENCQIQFVEQKTENGEEQLHTHLATSQASTCKETEKLITIYECLKKQEESEYDKIAKTWALELKKLKPDQQIHAKKAINDILYEGQLGNLYRNCVNIDTEPTQHKAIYYNNSATDVEIVENEEEEVVR